MPDFPKLPVLGWSAYAGERKTRMPGVADARHRRHTISGRAAISLALHALGAKAGRQVLVPTYHCATMILPVVHAGLRPVFFPVTQSGAPDLEWLGRADLAGTSALLAAHYFGLPQPMVALRAFCDERGIGLIEDCAHAYFGTSEGKAVGSWGDVAIASLTKFFPVSEGGLLASATLPLDSLHLSPRSLRDEVKAAVDAVEIGASYGRFPGLNALLNALFALKRRLRGRTGPAAATADESHEAPRTAFPSTLLASVQPADAVTWIAGSVHLARIVEMRRRNYAALARLLSGMTGARVMMPDLPEGAVPYVFPLYVNDPEASYQRLRATGIPIFRWDQVWPDTPVIANDCGLDWATHVFQIGCHQDLSEADIEEIAATVKTVIEERHPRPRLQSVAAS